MTLFFVGVEPPRATATNPLLGNVLAAVSAVTFALVVIGYRWLTQRPGGSAASVAAAAVSGNVLAFALSLPWMFPVDRKSTRLNSSHRTISYAVFCLKKKRVW